MKDKRIDNSFIAIEKGENESVKTLFSEVGIDALDCNGRTLLLNAAFYNNLELVQFAIENGANINHQDSIGFSSLHFAVQEQHVESINVLLTHNISIDLQDKYGNSALWRAVMNDVSVEIIEILLKHGANAKLQNYSEVAPIDLIDEDNAKMVQLFNHYSSMQR